MYICKNYWLYCSYIRTYVLPIFECVFFSSSNKQALILPHKLPSNIAITLLFLLVINISQYCVCVCVCIVSYILPFYITCIRAYMKHIHTDIRMHTYIHTVEFDENAH